MKFLEVLTLALAKSPATPGLFTKSCFTIKKTTNY